MIVETIAETKLKTEAKQYAQLAVDEYGYQGNFLTPKFKALRAMSERTFEDFKTRYCARWVYVIQFWVPLDRKTTHPYGYQFRPLQDARYRVVAIHDDSGPPPSREKGDA